MKQVRNLSLALLIVVLVATFVTLHAAAAAVQSASRDGEATVYLVGKFSKSFDVAYRATLRPGSRNTTWSTLSMLLIGSRLPGPSAAVGLASDSPTDRSVRAFTEVVYSDLSEHYLKHNVDCESSCIIELRGTAYSVDAFVNASKVASWSRSDLYLKAPYIQLNAEAHGTGDTIFGSLVPIRVIADGKKVHRLTCAFSNRGIQPAGDDTITFRGETNNSPGRYVDLTRGVHTNRC